MSQHNTSGRGGNGSSMGEAFVTSYRANLPPGFRARRHHIAFYELLSSVELVLAKAQSPSGWKQLLELIEVLDLACREHMDAEETSGMFTKLREALPERRERVIAQLEQGHTTLRSELSAIRDAVRTEPDVSGADPILSARLGAWLTDMYAHEDQELDLLKEAYAVD